ncbi:helix-turn-helix domain-containing protein [Pseudofrankia sp. BMG5.36]|uniref:helix-turn-helix domain-containing protein n=1 Tax=Pseudofrankia sp. BMG5.36 TaxID=1834512 RepID=UPI0008DA1F61|nr:helix-turn-helix domain-containing protein [Pseudofrankia sp. BMG5.36]OHV42640.1 CdaR family transcriptional regulator [Pseudofrankia sp. BMG5.36]
MRELVAKLAALDPDAGAAVKVIAYFDRLIEGQAGLEPIVRGAAVLAGCPARLIDDERRVHIEIEADGRRRDAVTRPDPAWLSAPVVPGGPQALWLERPGPAGPIDAMVLERATAAARVVLARTRRGVAAGCVTPHDPASVEVVLDATVPADLRLNAARRLGLDRTARARAVALEGGLARVEAASGSQAPDPDVGRRRAGVGPAVAVLELPSSWAAARTALRLTADGTASDPGPRIVHADHLGGLAVLAAAVVAATEPAPDVRALERVGADAPWMLATLDAIASSPSLRAAAGVLSVHHSTLQDRIARAEHLLGWSIREPQGRLRLQLALVLRRLHRNRPLEAEWDRRPPWT